MEWIWIAAAIVVLLIVVIRNIRVVQQSQAYVIERLGAFSAVWGVGIHFKVPFLERVAKRVSLKEQVLDLSLIHIWVRGKLSPPSFRKAS